IRANASSDLLWEGIHAQSPIGIVIAARELGKTSEKWNRMRYFVGRWRKRKAVKMEMIMSNQGVDHVIEKKKTNHVIKIGDLEEDFNVMDQPDDLTLVRPSRSGAMTAIGTARRSLTARRSMYSAPIAPHCDSGRCGGP
ncbi:hypothetical protein L249_4240, partial [Ophiocordyceps polyrhachis-furcata BCC 54312]